MRALFLAISVIASGLTFVSSGALAAQVDGAASPGAPTALADDLPVEMKNGLREELKDSPIRDRVLLSLAMTGLIGDRVKFLEYVNSLHFDWSKKIPSDISFDTDVYQLSNLLEAVKCKAFLESIGVRREPVETASLGLQNLFKTNIKQEFIAASKAEVEWFDRKQQEAEDRQKEAVQRENEAAVLSFQNKNWIAMQQAVNAQNYKKARELYAQVDDDKAGAEASDGETMIASDLLQKRGKMVYLALEFDSNASPGVLAKTSGDDRVYVSGVQPGSLVSGERFFVMAYISGTYTYRTIMGGTNTVPAVRAAVKF